MHRVLKRLLASALDLLFPPRANERLVRSATLEQVLALLEPRAIERAGAVALLPYRHPIVRALVKEAKFHDNREAGRLLGAVLAHYLDACIEGPATLVPVPLSRKRRRERGYNQAERIARHAITYIKEGFSMETELLGRIRHTPSQTGLGRTARLVNVSGAFRARRDCSPETAYILIDDVTTTGATLMAARAALQASGSRLEACLALAH
ncbi:MAG TPA: ComF family protein [Candidatus Paceibacterota bacterium]|nr:ComF family protein [Candidatus Paceibacterota bacterium]